MQAEDWDKIADDYYTEIISPIKNSTEENPLLEDIRKIKGKSKIAIDLGCGPGDLLPIIKNKFKHITAIDYSEAMIEQAKKKNIKNVTLKVKDMTNLDEFYGKFDCAFAINSILASNVKKLNKIIREIQKVLKPGGKLFAVLPAMEAFLYQAMLIIEHEMEKGKTQEQAIKAARKVTSRHDFIEGSITFEGDTQKTLYRFEVLHRLEEAGFKNIEIKKLRYSWKEWEDAGQEFIPGKAPPWDWYVKAEKK